MKYKFHLDISNTCTLHCEECLRQLLISNGQPPSMGGSNLSLEDFKKIADKTALLSFNGQVSDPIFNPHFIEMLEYLDKVVDENGKRHSTIYTAATSRKRDREWYKRAFNACKEIVWHFGIDGLPHQSHLYRKGQDGQFLFDMMCMAAEMGNATMWQYIVFNYNQDSIEEATELANNHNLNLQIVHSNRWGRIEHLKPSEGFYRDD